MTLKPLRQIGRWWQRWRRGAAEIPAPLWHEVLAQHPFVTCRPASELDTLRLLCSHFLADKEFHGTGELVVSDAMALTVALQACLPLVHWGLPGLRWYDDFVGIVIHPDTVVAKRESIDEAGVVHHYREALAGEAMAGGPVMLVWSQVLGSGRDAVEGHNLVIHEFAHKLDMRYKSSHEMANGCPRLPPHWMGLTPRQAQRHWQTHWQSNYDAFCQAVEMAERFGAPSPWLDAYGAQAPAEFFAVCCEAYFVNRPRFGQEFPTLRPLLDAFFGRPAEVSDAPVP